MKFNLKSLFYVFPFGLAVIYAFYSNYHHKYELRSKNKTVDSLSQNIELLESFLEDEDLFISSHMDSAGKVYELATWAELPSFRMRTKTREEFIHSYKILKKKNDSLQSRMNWLMMNGDNRLQNFSEVLADSLRKQKERYEMKIRQKDGVIANNGNEILSLKSEIQKALNQRKMLKRTYQGEVFYYFGYVNSNDEPAGNGTAVYPHNGGIYEGGWKDGMRHGVGVQNWQDGTSYDGEFEEDRREGKGTYIWKNGERYEGDWLDGKRHGKGAFYDKNKKLVFSGTWKNDDPIPDK